MEALRGKGRLRGIGEGFAKKFSVPHRSHSRGSQDVPNMSDHSSDPGTSKICEEPQIPCKTLQSQISEGGC